MNIDERNFLPKEEAKKWILSLKALGNAEWSVIELSMNAINPRFVGALYHINPLLTKDDIHIMLLFCLGLKNREIAKLLHVLLSSFRTRRNRLKTKLKINGNLRHFANQLFSRG